VAVRGDGTSTRVAVVRRGVSSRMSDASEYLLVLYRSERRTGAPVSSGDVAEEVGRSPSATTEMLQRLEKRGLVTHEPYEGATLTAEGRERAAELYDTYVTLARFFDEVLELDAHEQEAMALAGTLSPVVADRLETTILDDADATPADGPSASQSQSTRR
jgi:Mn-dependent DtxR family transcriptional regulator